MRSVGKLINSMLISLDGYTEDEHGRFGWGAPEDEEVHSQINALASSLGTYLYGRRMYETMVRLPGGRRQRRAVLS
jgi:dihydrofolate reductase